MRLVRAVAGLINFLILSSSGSRNLHLKGKDVVGPCRNREPIAAERNPRCWQWPLAVQEVAAVVG